MQLFHKAIVGIGKPDIQSYAKRGDILISAGPEDKMKGRLLKDHHFFVSVSDRQPSRYGVVKKLKEPISALDLALLSMKSQEGDIKNIDDKTLEAFNNYLIKINSQPLDTPMATTWLIKSLTNTKILRVHKVFFTGFSEEAKKEYFGF